MRFFEDSTAQTEFGFGAGGALTELHDLAGGNSSLLAPSFRGEGTDRVVQWTFWSDSVREDSLTLKERRLNLNEAGTKDNHFSPVVETKVMNGPKDDGCSVEILSDQKDLWQSELSSYMSAHLPAYTMYNAHDGVMTITRYVLIDSVRFHGENVAALNVYFEAWSPFNAALFDTVSLSLDHDGKPDVSFSHARNVPFYPKIPSSQTRGWVVLGNSRAANAPAVALAFGKASGVGGTSRLNLMDFNGGIALLPSITGRMVPVGSMLRQQIKLLVARNLDASLPEFLDRIQAETLPPAIFPQNSDRVTAQEAAIYDRLKQIADH